MSHLGDTNKMVSETPRTNQVSIRPQYGDEWDWCRADFARQLERELNAANQIGRKYEDRYFAALERIKRLEEAGDRMRLFCADPDDCFAWDKAKEAKL